jgi:branched-chain amino acid transport system permease protein
MKRPTSTRGKAYTSFIVVMIILAVIQPLLPDYYRFLLTEIMIYAIFAIGYDLLLGYTGLLSFGHSLLFGFGCYGFAWMMRFYGMPFWPALAITVIMTTALAAGVGAVCVRTSGIYFAIITFIFSFVFFYMFLSLVPITGGDDGFTFIPPPVDLGFISLEFAPVMLYYLALFWMAVAYIVGRRIVSSPFGRVMLAIRENDMRARCLGYNTYGCKMVVFMMSGIFTGLSGGLFAYLNHFVNAHYFEMYRSLFVLIWTMFGGVGTLVGPMFGAGIITLITDTLSSQFRMQWGGVHLIILGIILIVITIFLPRGILSIPERVRSRGKKEA